MQRFVKATKICTVFPPFHFLSRSLSLHSGHDLNTHNLRFLLFSISLKLDIEAKHSQGLKVSLCHFTETAALRTQLTVLFFGCSASSVVIEMENSGFLPIGFCLPFYQNLTKISDCFWASTKSIQTCADEEKD